MMKSYQDRAAAFIQQGDVARERGRTDEAIRAYREAIDLVPAYGTLHLTIADLLLQTGRFFEAAAAYQDAAGYSPENDRAWTGLGLCRLRLENHADALDAFRSALAANPQNPEANYYCALLLGMQGELKEAEDKLLQALRQRPDWEVQARREASLKPVFDSSKRFESLGRPRKWWEFRK